ncbi:MAG: ABC transporter permease [Armatimonadetes bacterium]|nr:ABC transporter permease [Armatimonadota bacterium]
MSAATGAAGRSPSTLLAGGFGAIGRGLTAWFQSAGEWCFLAWAATRYLLRGRLERRAFVRQMESIGVGSLLLCVVTVAFSSMVLAIYTTGQFVQYGFEDMVGYLISAGVVREGGPVLVAIVVAAREGSAIAAELASMKVTEQLDALRSLATDPVEYLVVPRLAAMLAATPMLTVMAGTAGVAGGYFIAAMHRIPSDIYWNSAARGISGYHLLSAFVKSLVFGGLVGVVSCHQGLKTGHGAAAVGRSVTASVVLCIVLVHAADFALVTVFGGD